MMNALTAPVSFELSVNQKELWGCTGISAFYNELTIDIHGQLDSLALENALRSVIAKHEVLRGRLLINNDSLFPSQYFIEEVNPGFNTAGFGAPYDPQTDEPVRLRLEKVADEKYLLTIKLYALWGDSHSALLFYKELYNEYLALAKAPEPEEMIAYRNFSKWQNDLVNEPDSEAAAFWRNYEYSLQNGLLPFESTGDAGFYAARERVTVLSGEKYRALQAMASSLQAQVEDVLLGVFSQYLGRFNENELTIGYTPSARHYDELNATLGLVLKPLPIRYKKSPDAGIGDIVAGLVQVKEEVLSWSDYFSLHSEGTSKAGQFFPYCFEYVKAAGYEPAATPPTSFTIADLISITHAFSLKLFCTDLGDSLAIDLFYDKNRFNRDDIAIITGRLQWECNQVIASAVINSPISSKENEIIAAANNTTKLFPDKSVIELFIDRVSQQPAAIALVDSGREIRYDELNEAVTELAVQLNKEYKIQKGDVVAIFLERSHWFVVAVLGVLRAGAAYVPIDPLLPPERVAYILHDCKAKVLISEQELAAAVPAVDMPRLLAPFLPDTSERDASFPAIASTDLAYIIYTSGSTGHPKGCMITHGNLSNYIQSATALYTEAGVYGNCGLITAVSFDLTVTCLYLPLVNGKTLFIGDRGAELPDLLQQVFGNAAIDTIKLTPAHLLLLKALDISNTRVRVVIVGGEQLTQEQVNAVWAINNDIKIYNEYGPTETTVGSIVKQIDRKDRKILIGKPIYNTRIYLLANAGSMAGIGERGEVYIAGAGVSRGYLHRADLTAEKFVSNPFEPGELLYRTGDVGRWLADGNIEYLGRNDDQIKLRGYRIEPGEIEVILQSFDSVEFAVVAVKNGEQGDAQLVAYFTAAAPVNGTLLRAFLLDRLPAYMVPAQFMQLEQFPLTANGKIDKAALLQIEALPVVSVEYVAPRNEIERSLVAVYEDVLKKQPIGIKEDFFMLGGDSIKSIQLVARLRQKGYALTIRDVLSSPVIAELAKRVKLSTHAIEQGPITGPVPLGPVQQAFFAESTTSWHHFNQSVLLKAAQPLSKEVLQQVLDSLVAHHDALRMVYRRTAGGWEQENKGLEHAGYSLEVIEGPGAEDETLFLARCQQVQASINLETGPLFKAALFRSPTGDRLLLVVHHLVIDGVSWRILFEDISTLYHQYAAGAAASLPLKSDSFQHWQQKQLAYSNSESLSREAAYWEAVEATPIQKLPVDKPTGNNLVQDIATIHFSLSKEQTGRLLHACYQALHTDTNDILLAALAISIKELFGITEVLIGVEGHGREQLAEEMDVSRTVGWFTTIYPVIVKLVSDGDDIDQLVSVKETLHRVPGKGIGYGILRYLAGRAYALRPEIIFNYLGDFGAGLQADTASEPLFVFSSDAHGREVAADRERSSLLDVSGMVVGDQLSMSISYSSEQYEASTIQKLSAAYKQTLVELTDRLAFEEKERLTPVDLTFRELSVTELQALNRQQEVEDVYPLSPLQEGMYYQWLVSPDTSIYFNQVSCRLKGELDIEKVAASYQQLVKRHGILRTRFTHQYGGRSLQVVSAEVTPEYVYKELSGSDPAAEAALIKEADRMRGFNLDAGSQMRLTLLRTAADTWEFIWSYHHILMDGWCLGLLIKEFFQQYQAQTDNVLASAGDAKPYSNYIQWLSTKNAQGSLAYWKDYLSGYETVASLPKLVTNDTTYGESRETTFALDAHVTTAIKELCNRLGVTESTFFHIAWGALLSRYNNSNDVVFGSVVSGRPAELEGVEEMVGLFINTIPVRVTSTGDKTFEDLLKEFHQASLQSTDHHYTQLAQIQTAAGFGQELFDHILQFQNYPVEDILAEGFDNQDGVSKLSLLDASIYNRNNFGFTVVVIPGNEIRLKFLYNAGWYHEEQVAAVQQHLKRIIQSIAAEPLGTVNSLTYISSGERHRLLYELNATTTAYPASKTVIQVFEEQVAKTPDNTAIIIDNRKLTYRELNERSNQLAHYLKENYTIERDTLIGIKLERSERPVIAMLAILKAGGAYVPVDPGFPAGRINYMLQDSKTTLVIDEQELETFATRRSRYSKQNPLSVNQPDQLAYVMYTSGSTGNPKGVMIQHTGIVRLVKDTNYIQVREEDVILSLSNFVFDGSTFDIYGALLNGAALVISGNDLQLDLHALDIVLKNSKVSLFFVTTALFNTYADSNLNFDNIRCILFGGEMVSVSHVKKFQQKFPAVQLLHMYGPTENTTYSTWQVVEPIRTAISTIPIGIPVSNTSLYIIDSAGMPAPVGIAGEICLGGPGLARGYLNSPELTAEKFVPNPCKPGELMYRTGDLGKWRQEGVVEIMGRIDNQVKIRGFRIELGEIENCLNSYTGIDAAAVIAVSDNAGDKELMAYVMSKTELDPMAIISYAGKSLPAYMIPRQIMQVNQLPLTATGKIDKRKLAGMQGEQLTRQKETVAPRNEPEAAIVSIWQKILGKQEIGITNDFFESGGDSIKVIRLISEIKKQLNWQLAIADVYKNSTIETLAGFYLEHNEDKEQGGRAAKETRSLVMEHMAGLKEGVTAAGALRDMENVEDVFPMSDISRGMMHESLMSKGEGIYHDQIVMKRTFPAFNLARLQQVIDLLAATHAVLRSEFNIHDYGVPLHIIRKKMTVPVQYESVSGYSKEGKETVIREYLKKELLRSFDLAMAPLWRITVFNTGNDEYVFIWQIHHAIIDGFSCALFIQSVFDWYHELANDASWKPAPLKLTYKDFVIRQQVDKHNDAVTQFWQQELAGFTPVTLFEDPIEPVCFGASEGRHYFRKVKYGAEWLGTDVKVLSFSAWLYMLSIVSGHKNVVAGLVTNTRPEMEDADKVIGCFLNTIPFSIDIVEGESCAEWVKRIHSKVIRLKKYEKLSTLEIARIHTDKLGTGNPFFDVIFNYVNFHEFRTLNDDPIAPAETADLDLQSNFRTNTFFDFTISTTGEGYNINLDQLKRLKSGFPAERIIELYTSVLNYLIDAPEGMLSRFEVVTAAEKEQLLHSFNNTAAVYPRNRTVAELFEAQVKATPDNTAITCVGTTLSYSQVNEQANQLARFIKEKYAIQPGQLLALQVARSEWAVIAMLAILKIGAAYVPVDMDYPEERVQFMLEDSGCKGVIDTALLQAFDELRATLDVTDLPAVGGPDSLAYVMYTSGSTGMPKGVMIEQASIVRLVKNTNYVSVAETDCILSLSNFVFDGSTFDIYAALLNGAGLVIPEKEALIDPASVNTLIQANKVTKFFITTALFNTFTDSELIDFNGVRQLFFGGELVSVNHVRKFMLKYPSVQLVHVYGPTENTTFSTFYPITSVQHNQHTVPIGRSIANSECYVLNAYNRLVPVGVTGEICVSGDGLAAGYLNRTLLTREKFVPHPYKPGKLLYKTGDTGKWLADGNIEFIGRTDDQVKIRGHRIETGEIEKVLQKHAAIREVIVLPLGDGANRYLCAYYTATEKIDGGDLRTFLYQHLPAYMIPAQSRQLNKMPLTKNGKIDKKALPVPEMVNAGDYIAPRNEVEEKLTDIWAGILNLEKDRISIDSNFFELGGHSLKANDLVAKIHKEMGARLPVAEVFKKPTIEELAELIGNVLWVQKENSESEYKNEIEI